MVLHLPGRTGPVTGPDLLATVCDALAAPTAAFLTAPPPAAAPPSAGPSICVLQGEAAFAPAAEAATLGSADATTCVIVALRSTGGASVVHVDAATAPATAHALWAGHPPSAGPASVYLVGGYDDGGGPSSTGPAAAAAALASLAAHARAATVRLAVLASCDAAGRPVATGLALRSDGGGPPWRCEWGEGDGGRGPAVPTRVARLWESGEAGGGAGGSDRGGERGEAGGGAGGSDRGGGPRPLARLYDGGGLLTVAPLAGACGADAAPAPPPPTARPPPAGWPSRRAAVAWLAAQPDAALLAAASTSPAVEPPRFLTDLRAALALLLAGAGGGGAARYRWRGGRWEAVK